jgi:signal recognition particle receptor subunit beta
MEILLLGTSSSGKTVLVRQLRQLCQKTTKKKRKHNPNNTDASTAVNFNTKPTVGVELDTLIIDKRTTITIREVGSPMAPMWSAFHGGCSALLFLIDTSDLCIPEAAVELWHTLNSKQLQGKPILIVGTKKDIPSLLSEDDILRYLRFDELKQVHTGSVNWAYLNLTIADECKQSILKWISGIKEE